MRAPRVLIIGASDLGSACVLRLSRSGIAVAVLDEDRPLDIYHSRSYSSALFLGNKTIEGLRARTIAAVISEEIIEEHMSLFSFINFEMANREIPIIALSDSSGLKKVAFEYIVLTKNNLVDKANLGEAVVIGFAAARNEVQFSYTIGNCGFNFGKVLYPFLDTASMNKSQELEDRSESQRVKAPIAGVFNATRSVNDIVLEKEELGRIAEIPILSPLSGRITGLLNSGMIIPAKIEFAEINKNIAKVDGNLISKESITLSGAVLEAIMFDLNLRNEG